MNSDRQANRITRVNPGGAATTSHPKGNILVYLVVVILIFGVLGVSLVSLFTTASSSSATPNDAKRARFIAESGIRYALSEIRNSLDIETAAELLNTTAEFKLGKNGGFTANVFSPGLESDQNKTIGAGGSDLRLNVPFSGKFPEDFDVNNAANDVYIVDWFRFKGTSPPDDSFAVVTASPDPGDATDVTLDVGDSYDANIGDTVCFALLVTDGGTISEGNSVYVNEKAAEFFPERNGAIRIFTPNNGNQYDYYYETREAPSAGKVELTNVQEIPGDTWSDITNLQAGDYVILSPFNFRVFASGTSDQTTVDVGYDRPFWALARPSEFTIYMRELLQDKSVVQEGDVIRTQEAGEKMIELGKGTSGTEGFGDLWYGGDKSIGGVNNFCNQGRCLFDLGVRVFFTADVIPGANDGQGFTFALIAGGTLLSPVNTRISAGGDFQLPELLGYAGNSQLDNGPTYLDTTGSGLIPPKMAVEFDTNTDFDAAFNSSLAYCSGSDLVADSRNDPKPENQLRDVVQYVFWGNNTAADFDLPCRITAESYDDNRHDPQKLSLGWSFTAGGALSFGRPAIGADGTVYMSDRDRSLFAFNPDGTVKWTFILGDSNDYAPGIDRSGGAHDGTIYSDTSGNSLVAINPDGTEKWRVFIGSDLDSTPTVGSDGSIYFGTDAGDIIKLNPDDRNNGLAFPTVNEWIFPTLGEVDTIPALSPDESVVYAVSNEHNLYAVNTLTGLEQWRFPILTEPNEINSSPVVNPDDGTIYVGADDNNVYAINPNGTEKWRYATGNEVESSAGLDPNDGTIYIGSDDSKVHAINPDGTAKGMSWPFTTGGPVESSPIVRSDGIVFFGSGDNKVYAVLTNGVKLWEFPTGGDVPSSPAFDRDGFIGDGLIYIGSEDDNFYALASLAKPRNYRNTYVNFQQGYLTSANLDSTVVVDSNNNWLDGAPLTKGPWAVRTEIERASSVNANGNYEYTLRTWIRQCAQSDCNDVKNTPFQDTAGKYDFLPGPPFPDLPFEQVIELTPAEHNDFERFLFGFTTAAGATDTQVVEIRDFQLTFIQPSDPNIIADPTWLP